MNRKKLDYHNLNPKYNRIPGNLIKDKPGIARDDIDLEYAPKGTCARLTQMEVERERILSLLKDAQDGLKVLKTMTKVEGFKQAQFVTEQIIAEITGLLLTTSSTTPTGDMVLVRRDDLEYLMEFSEFVDQDTRDRLKSALTQPNSPAPLEGKE